uniref:BTB domain-containing protein n=1 Tax=Panagrolaimus sp. JU765 TaxID=591449 RepID=A0AC34Q8R6_9BILA
MRRRVLMNPIWNDLFDNGGSGDYVIIAKGEEMKLSKELLKIHSSAFVAMFETDCVEAKENKIEIKDFTFDVVKIIVKILYSGTVPHGSTFEMMQKVCRFADKYDLEILFSRCSDTMV